MAIKTFFFDYNLGDASATFKVDTDKFKKEDAILMLDFFTWDYDKDNDPIDEIMKKYALKAIWVATAENYNAFGVKKWFKESEGFLQLDGELGIELIDVSKYEFDEWNLDIKIS